ncbi:MAG: hypothetical protein IKZ28_00585, partial [Clostridia bacterium]|nr:hypothetical protein [Clostridia bacterium]
HLSVSVSLSGKENYSAEDIENALMRAILSYGYPKSGESVTGEDGEPISQDGSFAEGTYKLKFYMNTIDGVAEAYAYVILE